MLGNSFEMDSFLDDREVQILLKFSEVLPKTFNDSPDKKAYTTGFPVEKIPVKNFHSRLEAVFGKCNVTVAMILEEFTPWIVHTDYLLPGDKNPYYAVLIPLEHDNKDTHTIVFNELGTEENWREQLIEDKNYNYTADELRLLSHHDENILKKLSLGKVHKWEKGKMIAWHRSLLHTSDNFKVADLKQKTALVLFLNKDD